MKRVASRWSWLLMAGTVLIGLPTGAAAQSTSWTFAEAISHPLASKSDLSLAKENRLTPDLALTKRLSSSLVDQLDTYERWRSAGRTLTWTGIVLASVGAGVTTVGAFGVWAGIFSFNLGAIYGGSVLFYTGIIAGGVGVLAMVVGIPLWAIFSSKAERLRKKLLLSHPLVGFDPQRKAMVVGWNLRF